MLTTLARRIVPLLGRLGVSRDGSGTLPQGCVVAANHTSLADPSLVLAALDRLRVSPVIMAAAGLWRIPLLGERLAAEGHIPVHRGSAHAAEALERAGEALARGRVVLIYPEGGLPRRPDSGERMPGPFRSGLARLVTATGVPIVPLGQAGARRITSGHVAKQIAGAVTAPLRQPRLHVHIGAPLRLAGPLDQVTAQAHTAVTRAWRTAIERIAETGQSAPSSVR